MASQSIILLIVFYIIAFIYVKEPHYKYFGYIMLAIVYMFSLGIAMQNRETIQKGFAFFENVFLQNMVIKNVFLLCVLCIVVFNLYSLIRIINAYWVKSKTMKSFDLKLNERHKKNLLHFDNSFIVGNVASTFLLFSFSWSDTGIEMIDNIKKNMTMAMNTPFNSYKIWKGNPPVVYMQAVLFFVSFVCVWIETAYSTQFSYIKHD
jgi:hypothetical protein